MKHHVLLKAIVNVKVIAVEAPTKLEAAEKAREFAYYYLYDRLKWVNRDGTDWDDIDKAEEMELAYTEFGEDIEEALVDQVGDEYYDKSEWYNMRTGKKL